MTLRGQGHETVLHTSAYLRDVSSPSSRLIRSNLFWDGGGPSGSFMPSMEKVTAADETTASGKACTESAFVRWTPPLPLTRTSDGCSSAATFVTQAAVTGVRATTMAMPATEGRLCTLAACITWIGLSQATGDVLLSPRTETEVSTAFGWSPRTCGVISMVRSSPISGFRRTGWTPGLQTEGSEATKVCRTACLTTLTSPRRSTRRPIHITILATS